MTEVVISQEIVDLMESHVASCYPEEGCGLLAGKGQIVDLTIPITNQLHSSVRYNMEPRELVQAFYKLDELGLELLASFHSHPQGPAYPSLTDIDDFLYPGTPMLIWSFDGASWKLDGFEIVGGEFIAIRVEIV